MRGDLVIQGAKKGGGGRAPVESKDSLRSAQWAEVLDLVSEGPIKGLVTGDLKSVYLDNVPIENADGTRNFKIDSFAFNTGTQGQTAMMGFDTTQSEVGVSLKVTVGTPIVRSVPAGGARKVRVTVGVPELSKQSTTNGDLGGASVEFAIDVQNNGGGYVEKWRKTIDGKTTTRYQKSVLIDLVGSGPWDVRMRRITPDSTTVTLRNEVWFDSMTLINSDRLRYPNSALCGLRVAAEQFSRIPGRAYLMDGRIIQVPSNYDPATRRYTGAWDGTFKYAHTDCPPWIYYDLLTNERYGLGRRILPQRIDKWQLYKIARYCDAVDASGVFVGVPDGRGGMEPRFTCNVYLASPGEAYKVLQDLAAVFRGIVSYTAGSVNVTQDAPDAAYSIFTPANVTEDGFSYESSSQKVKKSSCAVWWNNPENQYKREQEYFQDPDLVAKYGIDVLELSPLGCTSRGQAIRLAKWALYSESTEGELVHFTTGSLGAAVPLGRVFRVADPSVSGEQLGGLVSSASLRSVTLDRPVSIRAGESWTLHVMVPDALSPMGLVTLSKAVTNGPGLYTTLALSSPMASMPSPHSPWVLESSAVTPTTWRCVRVSESGEGRYDITGVAHNPGKYDLIERGIKTDSSPVSRMREDAPVATGLSLRETVYRTAGVAYSRVSIGWIPPAPALQYRVSWRLAGGPWTMMPLTAAQSVDVDGLAPGLLEVSIRTVNPLGSDGGQTLDGSLQIAGDPVRPWGVVLQQPAQPATGAAGDIWIDTDDGNRLYLHDGTSWVSRRDSSIDTALQAAATAKDTADGKIDTFYQPTAPSTGTIGDLWIDTDDANKLYRHNGSSWVLATDTRVGQALNDAATAQATADGKVTTYFGSATPIGADLGDLWYSDATKLLSRWSGSTWIVVSNSYTNTNQLVDGANLGGTATMLGQAANLINCQTEFANNSTVGWWMGSWVVGAPFVFQGAELARYPEGDWVPPGGNAICLLQGAPATTANTWGNGDPYPGGDALIGVAYTEKLIPVEPNKRYCASAFVASHRCTVDIYLEFHKADGSNTTGGGSANSATATGGKLLKNWKRLAAFGVAPDDAVSARILFAKRNTLPGYTDSYAWMTQPMIERAGALQTVPSSYSPGSPTSVRQIGYTGDLDATLGAPAGTFVAGKPAAAVSLVTQNFNTRNDRIATPIPVPFVPIDGSSIDHTLNKDGSADVSFEWIWTGDEATIDGFEVLVYQGAAAADYSFGVSPNEEVQHFLGPQRRALILQGVAADRWYTFGVRAYRIVDQDISAAGRIVSALIKPSAAGESPYQPTSQVAFNGTVTGTVNGIPAAQINVWGGISGRPDNIKYLDGSESIKNDLIGQASNLINCQTEFANNSTVGWWMGSWVVGAPFVFQGAELARFPQGDWVPPGGNAICLRQGAPATTANTWGNGDPYPGGDALIGVAYTEKLIPVEPNKRYCASAFVASHRCTVDIYLEFHKADGSNTTGGGSANSATATGGKLLKNWKRLAAFGVAPDDAVSARILFAKRNTLPGYTDSYAWMTQPMIERAGPLQTVPSAYSPSAATSHAQLGLIATADVSRDAFTEAHEVKLAGSMVIGTGGVGNPYLVVKAVKVLYTPTTDCIAMITVSFDFEQPPDVDPADYNILCLDPGQLAQPLMDMHRDTGTFRTVRTQNGNIMDKRSVRLSAGVQYEFSLTVAPVDPWPITLHDPVMIYEIIKR